MTTPRLPRFIPALQPPSQLVPVGPKPDGYVTYVVYSVPDSHMLAGGVRLIEVDSRDVAALDIPADAFSFYFCDAPSKAVTRDPLSQEMNLSQNVFIAAEIITAAALRHRLIDKGLIMDPPPPPTRRDKDGNILQEDLVHSIWVAKSKSAAYHCITPDNRVRPIRPGQGITVIDQKKNILMGADDMHPRDTIAPSPVSAPPKRKLTPPPKDTRFRLKK